MHVCLPAAAFDAKQRLWRTKVKLGKTPGSREPARGGYLFNQKALAKVFAAKCQAALTEAGLALPSNLPQQWVVDCKAVGDGQKALGYLGRYLYRGVISERDILRRKDGQVTYRWRDAKTGRPATRTLPGADFLWLVLQHVLPKGFQRARNFGFLHHNCRQRLQQVQLTHRVSMPATSVQPPHTRPLWRCACGQPMVIVRRRVRADAMSALSACTAQQTLRPDKPDAGEVATH